MKVSKVLLTTHSFISAYTLTIIIIDNYSSIVWSEDPTSQWSCHGQHDTEVFWNFWDRVVEDLNQHTLLSTAWPKHQINRFVGVVS